MTEVKETTNAAGETAEARLDELESEIATLNRKLSVVRQSIADQGAELDASNFLLEDARDEARARGTTPDYSKIGQARDKAVELAAETLGLELRIATLELEAAAIEQRQLRTMIRELQVQKDERFDSLVRIGGPPAKMLPSGYSSHTGEIGELTARIGAAETDREDLRSVIRDRESRIPELRRRLQGVLDGSGDPGESVRAVRRRPARRGY